MKALQALIKTTMWMQDELKETKETGGYDHEVGLCLCSDYALLDSNIQLIEKGTGKSWETILKENK